MLSIVLNQTQTISSDILIAISGLMIAIEISDSHQRLLLMNTISDTYRFNCIDELRLYFNKK